MGVHKKNKCIIYACGVLICMFLCVIISNAAGSAKVMQTHTGESEISIYVKGVDEDFSNAAVQIGTAECKSVRGGRLSELKNPVKTLIMIDNSLSIPEPARAINAQILQNIISDREAYEQIAIATFDEEARYLTEYTSDYSTLKAAVDNISHQNLETRLTDVLYGLLSEEYSKDTEDAYRRIIVFSDGVDSKSANCTKAELESMISKSQIPIYTVGIGKDEAQLGEMFALSRLSNGDSFKLDGMENLMDINAALNADRNIVRFAISPQGELMDGSRKMVKISFASGESLSVEVRMPQQTQADENMPVETEIAPETAAETVAETAVEKTPEQPAVMPAMAIAIGAIIALAVAAIIALAIFLTRKRLDSNPASDSNPQAKTDSDENKNKNEDVQSVGQTWHTSIQRKPNSNTMLIFGNNAPSNIKLTDMDSPHRSIAFPLKKEASIGAEVGCDIRITSDECISKRHCKIKTSGGKFYLEDTQSTNGTLLDDLEIKSETEIISGNIITIGNTRLRFDVEK